MCMKSFRMMDVRRNLTKDWEYPIQEFSVKNKTFNIKTFSWGSHDSKILKDYPAAMSAHNNQTLKQSQEESK